MFFTLAPQSLVGMGLLCAAAASPAQSLTEVVQLALTQYPTLSAAQGRSDAAQAEVARVRSAHQPQIGVGASLYGDASGSVPASLGRRTVSPNARLNVWSGGRIEAEAERAQALAESSQAQQRLTEDDVALQACEAYLSWERSHDLLTLAQHNLQAHQRTLEDIRQIAQVDTGRRIDLAQAQVRVDNARLVLLSRQADVAISTQRLRRFWSATWRAPVSNQAVTDLAKTPLGHLPPSLDAALSHVDDALPALAHWRAQVTAAQAAVRQAQGLYWPTIELSGSRQFNAITLRHETLTQLQLNMPLYNGQATRAQIDSALAQLRAAEANLAEARLQLMEKVTQAWEEWQSAQSRALTGAAQSDVGEGLVEGYRQQFRLARRSLLDLLNIQADTFNYRQAARTAFHEERMARARLLSSLGDLARRFSLPGDTPVR